MGHNIPTFFFPVHKDDLKGSEFSEKFVQEVLGEKYETRFDEGVREVSSRNWWYQETALELAKQLDISGLNFLLEELLLLDKPSLSQAADSLAQLISEISSTIPVFSEYEQEEYSGIKELRKVDCSLAYERSSPAYEVNPSVDSGFEAVVGFYSFLKSMRAAIYSALEKDQYLIYYRPQP
jgi:hypothetical protein